MLGESRKGEVHASTSFQVTHSHIYVLVQADFIRENMLSSIWWYCFVTLTVTG